MRLFLLMHVSFFWAEVFAFNVTRASLEDNKQEKSILLRGRNLDTTLDDVVLNYGIAEGKSNPCKKTNKGTKGGKDKCPAVRDEITPNLIVSQANEPGFGDVNNKYSLGMATFGDYVYVGTLNAPNFPVDLLPWFLGEPLDSNGAKVFRGKIGLCGEWEWHEVLDFGDYNPNNFGVRDMLVVDSYLYFVTANHEGTPGNGVEVWQTKDGVTWSRKSEPGFGDPSNISGRSLAACGGYLYVGVENRDTGAQLWRHPLDADGNLTSGGSWLQVPAANNGFGNSNNYFISELVLDPRSNNELYAGTLNGFDGMELWKITSCVAAEVTGVGTSQIFSGGWPGGPVPCPLPTVGPTDLCITNSGALTLQTAMTNKGWALFLGTVNYIFGASLFVSFDGTNFIPIFLFGNGDDRLSYVWSMEVYKGRLYIGTFQRPNLRNFLDLPSSLGVSAGMEDPLEDINPEDAVEYMQLLEDLAGSPFSPVLPGITDQLGDIDLDEVVESGEFTLFSLYLSGFNTSVFPPVSVVTETSDSFGSCYQYGIRTMTLYEDKLILGTAGASSRGGTLVFEATGLS